MLTQWLSKYFLLRYNSSNKCNATLSYTFVSSQSCVSSRRCTAVLWGLCHEKELPVKVKSFQPACVSCVTGLVQASLPMSKEGLCGLSTPTGGVRRRRQSRVSLEAETSLILVLIFSWRTAVMIVSKLPIDQLLQLEYLLSHRTMPI